MRLTILPALALAACASGQGAINERDFSRPELSSLPLSTVELVVVVAGPPRVAEERFEVRGFEPVAPGTPLLEGAEDAQTRDALASELRRTLESQGYRVTVRTAQAARPAAPASVATSSTSTTTAVAAIPSAPAAPQLEAGMTVDAIRAQSTSDVILVVRAVPVDRFSVDVGTGTRIEETPLGRERVLDSRLVAMDGRLLVGQAFLFDRATGVRLWSRQAPGYPDDGRLTRGHPFLATGYVQDEGAGPAPPIVRATAASRAFTRSILTGLPRAQAGDPSAREALSALDLELVTEQDAFFDASHVALELGLGWGLETNEIPLLLDDAPLPDLGAGAMTPVGIGRIAPRLAYVAPGGRMYGVTVPLVLAPSSFGRTYVRDNPQPTESDPHRVLRVDVGGVVGGGLQLELGQLVWLAPDLYLVPRGGAFLDVWVPDISPDPFADDATRIRVGAVLGLDLWKRLGERWYLRGGLDGRIGADVIGTFLIGGALTLGAGLLL